MLAYTYKVYTLKYTNISKLGNKKEGYAFYENEWKKATLADRMKSQN